LPDYLADNEAAASLTLVIVPALGSLHGIIVAASQASRIAFAIAAAIATADSFDGSVCQANSVGCPNSPQIPSSVVLLVRKITEPEHFRTVTVMESFS